MNAVFTMCSARASGMAKLDVCLKMVLFHRINLNSLPLLSHYCKFSTSAVKFKSRDNASIENSSLPNKVNLNGQKLTELKTSLFDKVISKRRDQASRSILVQIPSVNLYEDLQSYCNQFGKISNMHYYEINKDYNYVLIEFQYVTAINEVMSHASFKNKSGIVSAKSPILCFRKGHPNTSHNWKNNKQKISINNRLIHPNENDIAQLLRDAKSISAQMVTLYDTLKLDDLEIRLRFHTACYLEKYFSGLFQNMKVLPFGSTINGFGKKSSDIDLVIVPDDIKRNVMNRLTFHTKPIKRNERQEIREFLGTIASAMQCFIPGIKNIRRILEARVPILKFYYEYIHLECDLSVTNMTAIYMSELLYLYGEIDWRVRPLTIAIRQWAKSQKITYESPGPWITNFSLTLLVLFYLQQKKILPSLNILRKYATVNEIRFENGIDCSFLRNISSLPAEYIYKINQDNLEDLLHGFFEYYEKFDFQTKGICIREGAPIKKATSAALHIINPLETHLNVSKNVNIFELNRMKQKVHEALYILETTNKSVHDHWGFMALLNTEIISTTNFNSKINKEIQNSSEAYHNYYEVNESDIAQSEIQKKESKEIV